MAVAVGQMGGCPEAGNLTKGQRKAHLVIWILLASLLILGVIMAARAIEHSPLSGIKNSGDVDRAGGSGL